MEYGIDKAKIIAINLTAEQWQTLLQMLGNGPFNIVAPLINTIQQQCMEHAEPLEQIQRVNGDARQELN
jgi:hypothetical protein